MQILDRQIANSIHESDEHKKLNDKYKSRPEPHTSTANTKLFELQTTSNKIQNN